MKGKFIVIEGLDGAGKSTQVELLTQHFDKQNIAYKFIHFPMMNQGIYGTLVAEFLRGEFGSIEQVHPKLVALLFANDRLEHIHTINQWLKDGYTVLADRYVNSNIAFQCAKLKKESEKQGLRDWILDFEFNTNNLPKPDHYLFLNVPFNAIVKSLSEERVGADRDYLDGNIDIHEASIDFQKLVYTEYLQMISDQDDFTAIDCSDGNGEFLNRNLIHNKIWNFVN